MQVKIVNFHDKFSLKNTTFNGCDQERAIARFRCAPQTAPGNESLPSAMQNIYELPSPAPLHDSNTGKPLRAAANERRALLLVCGGILFLSSVLGINQAGQVYVPPFADHGLPAMCATKILFHRDCPGCGITRSLISLGHGNWRASLAYHPAGIAFYLFLWAQVLSLISSLCRLKNGQCAGRSRVLTIFTYAIVAAFLATGVFRILTQ
jgi:hypothetical protein